jgi:hypothetical protein
VSSLTRDPGFQISEREDLPSNSCPSDPQSLDFASFAVDGRPDLGMIVYTPATREGAARIEALSVSRGHRPKGD